MRNQAHPPANAAETQPLQNRRTLGDFPFPIRGKCVTRRSCKKSESDLTQSTNTRASANPATALFLRTLKRHPTRIQMPQYGVTWTGTALLFIAPLPNSPLVPDPHDHKLPSVHRAWL